jgi:hypothetical protein
MQYLRKLKYAHWYALGAVTPMPLETDLEEALPAADTRGWVIRWPNRYAWEHTHKRLDPIRAELARFAKVEEYDFFPDWHVKGGFPLDVGDLDCIRVQGYPKNAHDLRGEIIRLTAGGGDFSFAVDLSDYPLVSSQVRDDTDLTFKFCCPQDHHPRIVPIGYLPSNSGMLAVARRRQRLRAAPRDIGVYGRFGSWTDASNFRIELVEQMARSGLNFVGSFGKLVPYPAYLQELRRSRICLDAPGQGPISYRLAEAMALGAVVVCRGPMVAFPEPLVPHTHYVPMRYDGSDVVEQCRYVLDDPARQDEIANLAAAYYDRNFTAAAIARRMLRHMAEVVAA